MNDNKFHYLANNLWQDIEEYIHNWYINGELDYEIDNNIFIIIFNNRTKIVINRQEPLYQIWMATRYSGYHFELKENKWICNRSGKTFWNLLNQAITLQINGKLI